ncbi:MAG TPA: hypothetical protein PKM73_13705 [Verrucomicrobiota bacterium]|nr:hypothetical protein [Verrucomicrobiota bacterium]HNU49606.1 hypothetical protein [Verrucomicrobiota bacterium]
MFAPRHRPLLLAAVTLLAIWAVALGGYWLARSQRVTPEKIRAFLQNVDFAQLRGEARAQALRELARKLNRLTYDDRRTARLDREWTRWFEAMTDTEKSEFIEATLPTGFRQMLGAFEQLPPDRRRRTVDEALKRLKEARDDLETEEGWEPPDGATNGIPVVSEAVRQQVITTGLKSFYSESSAQTKAEAAPLLEELQRMMENGAFLRGQRHP